eukprot:1145767-Pelagomonas_calceolata.AAC.4
MAGPNIEWTARCSMAVPCQKESVGLCHVMELQWVCLRAAVAVPLLEKCEDEDVRRLYRGCWSACFVIRRSCTCGSEALPKPGSFKFVEGNFHLPAYSVLLVMDARMGYSEILKIMVRFAVVPVIALLGAVAAGLRIAAANGKIAM